MDGWISVSRKITDNWVWKDKPFSYGQAWVHLLLSANYDDREICFDGKPLTVKRGSFVTSIYKLSDVFGWDRKKTSKFINTLEMQKMVTTTRSTRGTTISIVNYEKYQNTGTANGTTDGTTPSPTVGLLLPTNNKYNKDNNENNNIIISSESERSALNQSSIRIPLNDKSFYDVPEDKIMLWSDAYPAVNVRQELKRMIAWLESNPTKKKTRRGVERFINNWLSRTQDSGGSKTGGDVNGREGKDGSSDDYHESWERIAGLIDSTKDPFAGRDDVPFK